MTNSPTPDGEQPLYPVDRAFVVEIQRDATVAAGFCLGRVEHLSSGQVLRFEDVDTLLRFLAHAIGVASRSDAPDGAECQRSGGGQGRQ